MSSAPCARTRFSTENVPLRERLREWEHHHASALIGLRAQLPAHSALQAETATLTMPRLRLAKVIASPHSVRRDPTDIAEHPASGLVAYIPLAGRSSFTHHTGRSVLDPGHSMICDGDMTFHRQFAHGVNELVVHLPHETLKELSSPGRLNRATALDFDSSARSRIAAREFVRLADSTLVGGARDWNDVEERFLEILSQLLVGAWAEHDHVREAFAVIAETHRDPTFSAARLARSIGVSQRQLSRVFATAGHSVPHAVLTARLNTAHALLGDPNAAETSMAAIAACSGFRSLAQFSRSYSARFGISPLRHRRRLLRDDRLGID